ncbi:hypothetical protein [Polaribacter sp.]|uniref:hypothetical protein n=1 Tax=Polaribacter sp. TaxID=1920175 RepID=UPI003F6A7903
MLFTVFQIYSANRILYVDQFYDILGNDEKENNLLDFTVKNGFDKIILYDLHKINRDYPLADLNTNDILARFIFKAKINYGLAGVGGSGESADFFIKAIHAYNMSRINPVERFDTYNLEYEYWKKSPSENGGYYCINYLKKTGQSCNRKNSFKFFINSLAVMKKLAKENSHKVTVEAYVGKYYKHEIKKIANYVDRLLIHVYVENPKHGFNFANKRLEYLSEVKNMPKTSIIYSSEILFMGGWLKYNSLKKGENIFIDSLKKNNKGLLRKIKFTDFTYYNYNYLAKSVKYYNNSQITDFDSKIDKNEVIITSEKP